MRGCTGASTRSRAHSHLNAPAHVPNPHLYKRAQGQPYTMLERPRSAYIPEHPRKGRCMTPDPISLKQQEAGEVRGCEKRWRPSQYHSTSSPPQLQPPVEAALRCASWDEAAHQWSVEVPRRTLRGSWAAMHLPTASIHGKQSYAKCRSNHE